MQAGYCAANASFSAPIADRLCKRKCLFELRRRRLIKSAAPRCQCVSRKRRDLMTVSEPFDGKYKIAEGDAYSERTLHLQHFPRCAVGGNGHFSITACCRSPTCSDQVVKLERKCATTLDTAVSGQ